MTESDQRQDPTETRVEYDASELRRADLASDPVAQLKRWLDDAADAAEAADSEDATRAAKIEANAMVLATVGDDGRPRARNVLLRSLDERGLVFYSNRRSAKGVAMDLNPNASALFSWLGLQRQVRVDADVELITGAEADAYWTTRPRRSQVASAASPQGEVVADRSELEALVQWTTDLAAGGAIERPDHWVGYRLVPHTFEFWQGRRARLHDRFRYQQTDDAWEIDRLAP